MIQEKNKNETPINLQVFLFLSSWKKKKFFSFVPSYIMMNCIRCYPFSHYFFNYCYVQLMEITQFEVLS